MLTINGLLKYNNYIGHSMHNSLVLSSWFFYKLRKKVWIINLFKTIKFLKLVLKLLQNLASYSLPFWFVNLELSKDFIYRKYALECGEFACTKVWVRGFLSNFKSIQNSICKYMLKKHVIKKFNKMHLLSIWASTRFSWPRGIFLSDVSLNSVICKEASSIGLPVVALVDTNIRSYLFNYPIPSNDDSIESLNYILSIISKKLLISKYKKVLMWYDQYKSIYSGLFTKFKNLNKTLKFNNKSKYKYKYKYGWLFKRSKKDVQNKLERHYLKKMQKVLIKPFILNIKKRKILLHVFFKNLFSNVYSFIDNCKSLISNTQTLKFSTSKYGDKKFNNTYLSFKFHQKLKYLRKLKDKQIFNKDFLSFKNIKLRMHPLYWYRRSLYLKHLSYIRRTKEGKKNIYLYYYFISNFLKKTRIYYESFFFNKPSNFLYIRAFHRYYKPWYFDENKYHSEDVEKRWHFWNGYRFKLDKVAQEYWDVKKKFNQRLRANWKYNKKVNISDSAIIVNLERWLMYNKKLEWINRVGRFWLKFWLFPTFNRFSVKDANQLHWYNAKFFFKEDIKFRRRFNWKVANLKTPITAFQFYNSWFSFLFNFRDLSENEVYDESSLVNIDNTMDKSIDYRAKYFIKKRVGNKIKYIKK